MFNRFFWSLISNSYDRNMMFSLDIFPYYMFWNHRIKKKANRSTHYNWNTKLYTNHYQSFNSFIETHWLIYLAFLFLSFSFLVFWYIHRVRHHYQAPIQFHCFILSRFSNSHVSDIWIACSHLHVQSPFLCCNKIAQGRGKTIVGWLPVKAFPFSKILGFF
jgi:hypothetical protein